MRLAPTGMLTEREEWHALVTDHVVSLLPACQAPLLLHLQYGCQGSEAGQRGRHWSLHGPRKVLLPPKDSQISVFPPMRDRCAPDWVHDRDHEAHHQIRLSV